MQSARRASVVAMCLACVATSHHAVRTEGLQDLRPAIELGEAGRPQSLVRLAPTSHPPLPALVSQFWMVPERGASPAVGVGQSNLIASFVRGVRLLNDGSYEAGLPLVSQPGLASTPLASYAQYYTGVAYLRLDRFEEADDVFDELAKKDLVGFLAEGVPLRRAEVELGRKNPERAESLLEKLSREKTVDPEDVLLRWARATELAGHDDRALAIYRRVYFEFPMSPEADAASIEIDRLDGAALITPDRFKLELGRAERLFGGRRYQPARDAFARLQRIASGGDKELVALRIAESDYYLKRYTAARNALRPYLDGASREAEARFFYLTATRAAGDLDTYVSMARKLVEDFPKDSWSEEALNNLASHHILQDDDEAADRVFRELLSRFPQSRHAERAAWKSGWRAYRTDQFADAARIFEEAAAASPRADLRPAWLYWSGRAHDQLGDTPEATERYRIAVADYQNSYYGRLASRRLEGRTYEPVSPVVFQDSGFVNSTPNEAAIRQLIALELYDDALREVQYAQRVWGDSSTLIATGAWITHQQGLGLSSWDRFNRLRGAINTMKRAYPQYIASGGEHLPPDILSIVFPLQYWSLIKKYADQHDLDPYLIAALMAQESTFTADVRSPASAVGLMQLMPTTGRRYARKLNMRFTTASLTQPETNVRLGTTYFKELVDRFGGAHFALASYNAGESRVARWRSENPDLPQDEFIDDIPFPETQNYVKKILGTAEDYRRLYGGGLLVPEDGSVARAPASAQSASVKKPAASATTKKPAAKKPARKPATRRPAR